MADEHGKRPGFGHGTHILISVPTGPEEPTHFTKKLADTYGARVTYIDCFHSVPDPSVYRDVDVIVTLAAVPSDRTACPKLKYIHCVSAGTNFVENSPLFNDESVRWSYSSGIHGPTISEWVVMTYLAFEKKFEFWLDVHRNKKWSSQIANRAFESRDTLGQKIGILGYGSIGRQIGRVANAMGMEVIAFTATPKESAEAKKDSGYFLAGIGDPDGSIPKAWYSGLDKPSLHAFLAQGLDVLVLCLPLTSKTRGLVGREEFSVLAQHSPMGGAFVSNIARGDIIVQDDLVAALQTEGSGVRGAALDVASPEPLPPDSPLWTAPNCFITPHMSAMHTRYWQRSIAIMEENLNKQLNEPFTNEVRRGRGY